MSHSDSNGRGRVMWIAGTTCLVVLLAMVVVTNRESSLERSARVALEGLRREREAIRRAPQSDPRRSRLEILEQCISEHEEWVTSDAASGGKSSSPSKHFLVDSR